MIDRNEMTGRKLADLEKYLRELAGRAGQQWDIHDAAWLAEWAHAVNVIRGDVKDPRRQEFAAEDERVETFNALVAAHNKCLKSKPRKNDPQLAAWAMSKAERLQTLRRLLKRYAKPGTKFAFESEK